MVQFAHALEPEVNEKWYLAREMGITQAVAIGGPKTGQVALWDYLTLSRMKKTYEDFGFDLAVLEMGFPLEKAKQGLPGAEEETEVFCQILRNMGALGIPIMCYNWMTFFNWMRTSVTTRTRGGALTTSYDHKLMQASPGADTVKITEEKLWETLTAFLHKVVPVAEQAGVKLAMHPDDPPLSPIAGVGRIMRTPEAFERLIGIVESEANGITFCQGNFAAMLGVDDIPAQIHRFGKTGLMHFVHFRDLIGDATNLTETFHDDGKTDMFAAMKAYREVGFKGPMRPDHTPSMTGDANTFPGYEPRGRLFAIGYMKGLLEGADAMLAQKPS